MSDRLTIEPPGSQDDWRDLRDAHGKLFARLDTRTYLLEIKRSGGEFSAVFDLRDYLAPLVGLDQPQDIE